LGAAATGGVVERVVTVLRDAVVARLVEVERCGALLACSAAAASGVWITGVLRVAIGATTAAAGAVAAGAESGVVAAIGVAVAGAASTGAIEIGASAAAGGGGAAITGAEGSATA
jgi:hypothetical protein